MRDDYAHNSLQAAQRNETFVLHGLRALVSGTTNPDKLVRLVSQKGADIFTRGIADVANIAARDARSELSWVQKQKGRDSTRSYATPDDIAWGLADFYAQYLPPLTGAWSDAVLTEMQNEIAEGERLGENTNVLSQRIKNAFELEHSRAKTIIRTEGTRATTLTRRSMLQRSIEQDFAPDWCVSRLILDNRTTLTCRLWHDLKWLVVNDRLEYHPPRHYQCRGSVIWTHDRDPQIARLQELTEADYMQLQINQKREFPNWQQQRTFKMFDTVQAYNQSVANTVSSNRQMPTSTPSNRPLPAPNNRQLPISANKDLSLRVAEVVLERLRKK